MRTSQSDTESVAPPTAALKQDLEGVEAQLRGLADRRARVEAGLQRIACEETFLRRQQRRLLHGIFAAAHGEDAHAVECGPEVGSCLWPGADRSSCFESPLSCFWLD